MRGTGTRSEKWCVRLQDDLGRGRISIFVQTRKITGNYLYFHVLLSAMNRGILGLGKKIYNPWKRIGIVRYTTRDIDNVPKWVEKVYWAKWKRDVLYGKVVYIKGKRMLYKIVTHWPEFQGQTSRTYYRRYRQSYLKKTGGR